MFSVGLIIPSWHYWMEPTKPQPYWELYYGTLIDHRFADAEVEIIDLRGKEAKEPGFTIPEKDLYFYWNMKSADAQELYDVVADLRVTYPKAAHIGGGTHVDHHQEDCAGVYDAIVVGTAEELIFQAIGDWRKGALDNIYRGDMSFPFAEYPHPRRHYLPLDRIVNTDHFVKYGGVLGSGTYFSRGCSFRCRFCVYNFPPTFDFRTPTQMTEEIEYLKKEFGAQGINLRDEVCIPVNPKIGIPYLEAIGKSGIIWRGQTVPMGSEELVKLAAQSGCKELALGLESADSDLVLEISNKPSKSIDGNVRFIELCKKYGIKVKVCLILGLPGESEDVLDRTLRFLDDVRPDYVAVSGFDPVPGSLFFKDPKKYGIKSISTDLSLHQHLMFRFGDEEDIGLPFEYEEETPWGRGQTSEQIADNIRTVQAYLRENDMCY